jgi:hypothetical protein
MSLSGIIYKLDSLSKTLFPKCLTCDQLTQPTIVSPDHNCDHCHKSFRQISSLLSYRHESVECDCDMCIQCYGKFVQSYCTKYPDPQLKAARLQLKATRSTSMPATPSCSAYAPVTLHHSTSATPSCSAYAPVTLHRSTYTASSVAPVVASYADIQEPTFFPNKEGRYGPGKTVMCDLCKQKSIPMCISISKYDYCLTCRHTKIQPHQYEVEDDVFVTKMLTDQYYETEQRSQKISDVTQENLLRFKLVLQNGTLQTSKRCSNCKDFAHETISFCEDPASPDLRLQDHLCLLCADAIAKKK